MPTIAIGSPASATADGRASSARSPVSSATRRVASTPGSAWSKSSVVGSARPVACTRRARTSIAAAESTPASLKGRGWRPPPRPTGGPARRPPRPPPDRARATARPAADEARHAVGEGGRGNVGDLRGARQVQKRAVVVEQPLPGDVAAVHVQLGERGGNRGGPSWSRRSVAATAACAGIGERGQ